DVATDQLVQGAADVDLHEAGRLRANLVSDLAVGGDGGGDHRRAVARQQPGDITDAPDVGVAVLLGEAEPLGEVRSYFISVQQLRRAPAGRQLLGKPPGDRALPRTRQ